MTEETTTPEIPDLEVSSEAMPDELTMLKERAKLLGISFGPRIGVDALKEKIQAALDGDGDGGADDESASAAENPETEGDLSKVNFKKATPAQKAAIRKEMIKREMRMIRVRIANLNPAKKDLPGEVFAVGNGILGEYKKFIPFGEATDDGYHVPYIVFKQLKARKFLQTRVVLDKTTGNRLPVSRWVPEFAIEELDPLTPAELKQLQNKQAAAKGLE